MPLFRKRQLAAIFVPPASMDFGSEIARLKQLRPQAVLLLLYGASAGQAARQLKYMGFQGTLLAMNFINSQESLETAQGALDGTVYTNISDPPETFQTRFQQRFNRTPGFGAGHGHDAVHLLGEALCSHNRVRDIPAWMASRRNFYGALGVYSSGDDNDFNVPVILKSVRQDRKSN